MKSLVIAFTGLLAIGLTAARADLDLTPSQEIQMMERVPLSLVVFHDGAKEITYQPPRGWTCTGSHNAAALSIPEHSQARAVIQSAARVRIPAFDDKAQKLFEANPALLQLPRGAKDVKITGVGINPLIVDSHPTLEVQMTYSFFGQSCAKSILIVNRNGAEVSFTLDTLASDFQMLHTQFIRSVFSMENL
jgi:hypothetical protein